MSNGELVKLIRAQIKIEKSFVESASGLIKDIRNVAAKLLLLETKKDSEKHAAILKGILDVIEQKDTKPLWDSIQDSYIDQEVVRRSLESHIKTETQMLEHVQKEMKQTEDEAIRLLLQHIAEDEKKHHKILQTVNKNMYKV